MIKRIAPGLILCICLSLQMWCIGQPPEHIKREIDVNVSVNLPPFHLTSIDSMDEPFYSVEIRKKRGEQVLQRIEIPPYGSSLEKFKAEDINFDGYKDLWFLADEGVKNKIYDIWVYRPAETRFIKVFSEMCDTDGPTNPNVFMTYCDGGGGCGTMTTYKWVEGAPVVIKEVSTDMDGLRWKTTIRELIDGKLTQVSETFRDQPW